MSSDYKAPLTDGQKEILADLMAHATVLGAYKSVFPATVAGVQNEAAGDASDIGYILNMAHSYTSILHQQADYWKKRCLSAELRVQQLEQDKKP